MINNYLFIIGIFIAALFGLISFIGFLGTIFSSIYTQYFSSNENGVKKAIVWNSRFNLIKSVFWQWTIYVFALACFSSIVFSVLAQ